MLQTIEDCEAIERSSTREKKPAHTENSNGTQQTSVEFYCKGCQGKVVFKFSKQFDGGGVKHILIDAGCPHWKRCHDCERTNRKHLNEAWFIVINDNPLSGRKKSQKDNIIVLVEESKFSSHGHVRSVVGVTF